MGGHRDRRTEKQEGHRGTQARGYEGCCTAVEDDSMSTSFQIQTELQHLANTAIGFMEDLTRLKSSGALTMFGTLLSLCTELSAHPGLASTAPSATCASPATAALSADSPVKMVSVELTNHSGKGQSTDVVCRGDCVVKQLDQEKQVFFPLCRMSFVECSMSLWVSFIDSVLPGSWRHSLGTSTAPCVWALCPFALPGDAAASSGQGFQEPWQGSHRGLGPDLSLS